LVVWWDGEFEARNGQVERRTGSYDIRIGGARVLVVPWWWASRDKKLVDVWQKVGKGK